MPKSKYPTHIEPYLDDITQMIKEGYKEEGIAYKLGVHPSTWHEYKNKHEDFREAIKKGNCKIIKDLKNALLKRALGYEQEEKKTYQKHGVGGVLTQYIEITKKHYPPDVAAINLALKNYDRIAKDNPYGWLNDPAYYDLRKAEIELRAKLADAKEWTTQWSDNNAEEEQMG